MAAEAKQPPRGAVIVPNWNGRAHLTTCLQSLLAQGGRPHIIVVDNGSTDGSAELVARDFPAVELVRLPKNTGFTGGVNTGIRRALAARYDYIALLNNDAVAETGWYAALANELQTHPDAGIATAKIIDFAGKHLDSTGECYSVWGLPFARGRGEPITDRYDAQRDIFGASGGASIFRSHMLQRIGLFDDDFFAYYEDVDLSFRAQWAGWKVRYVPEAVVRHHIGATSGKIRGFTTYQTLKNLPLVFHKNVPWQLVPAVLPRLLLAYWLFFASAVARGQGSAALKGWAMSVVLVAKKMITHHGTRRLRTVPVKRIRGLLVYDLPPGADRLQAFVHPFRHKKEAAA